MIYQLSNEGRAVTFKSWKKMGGCGLSNLNSATKILGPEWVWPDNVTLGQIEDVCPYSGRIFARYAAEELKKPGMAKPYESEFLKRLF